MKLKELRKYKGLTQSEAAFICDIPLRTYKRIENENSYSTSSRYKSAFEKINKVTRPINNSISKKNIMVFGAGYVGFSLSVLLSTKHKVTVIDINEDKIKRINARKPLFRDKEVEYYLENKELELFATTFNEELVKDVDYVIIALPTNYDQKTGTYDMSDITNTIKEVRKHNKKCLIIIKSTSYVGYTKSLNDEGVIFSPEFLREGQALKDNLYPSRIIIGGPQNKKVKEFASILLDLSLNNPPLLYMSSDEAESVKLFSNAYLAMRVAYFNELDSFSSSNNMNSHNIVLGVSLDPRIGDYYNNPSFGYGGYCLPKDTAELISQMNCVENNHLISSIEESNKSRKSFIVNEIISKISPNSVVGVYSLNSKFGSDNTRFSSMFDVIKGLEEKGYEILIYDSSKMELEEFKSRSDIILTNRYSTELDDVKDKVYTKDLFKRD